MNIQQLLDRDTRKILNEAGAGGSDITIHWRAHVSGPLDYDRNNEDAERPVFSDKCETIRGFTHTPGEGNHSTNIQKFLEITVGDLILDLPAATSFAGKEDVRFEIDGVFYVQKLVGRELAEIWAAASVGNSGLKTFLVSRAA